MSSNLIIGSIVEKFNPAVYAGFLFSFNLLIKGGYSDTCLLVERAIWKVREKYDEASLISFSEEGICLEKLNNLGSQKAQVIIQEFITAFVTTLSRLIGQQLAKELTKQLDDSKED